jgi:hypothetical protein
MSMALKPTSHNYQYATVRVRAEYGTDPRSLRRRDGAVGPAAAERIRGDVISLKCIPSTFAQIRCNWTEAHRRERRDLPTRRRHPFGRWKCPARQCIYRFLLSPSLWDLPDRFASTRRNSG